MIDSHHHTRFVIVMYGLYGLMRVTALRSPVFKKKLKERDLALTMASTAETLSRTFRFFAGTVRWEKGQSTDSTVRLIWANPEKGHRIMLAMAKGNSRALMNAVINRDLTLEGDATDIKWFLDVITLLSRIYRKRKTQKKSTGLLSGEVDNPNI